MSRIRPTLTAHAYYDPHVKLIMWHYLFFSVSSSVGRIGDIGRYDTVSIPDLSIPIPIRYRYWPNKCRNQSKNRSSLSFYPLICWKLLRMHLIGQEINQDFNIRQCFSPFYACGPLNSRKKGLWLPSDFWLKFVYVIKKLTVFRAPPQPILTENFV